MIPLCGIVIGLVVLAWLFARRNERQPKHNESLSNHELIETMNRLNRMALERNDKENHV